MKLKKVRFFKETYQSTLNEIIFVFFAQNMVLSNNLPKKGPGVFLSGKNVEHLHCIYEYN